MKCVNCGSDFASDQLKCPYCGSINEYALKLAKELQAYDKDYENKRDELLNTGNTLVLKRITVGLGLTFLAIVLLFACYLGYTKYRYGSHSHYNVTGSRYENNKKLLKQYMDNKDYLRAYMLAATTDPTGEHFEYYSDYADELNAIYSYSLILSEINFVVTDMDNGDNYRAFTGTQAISYSIFFKVPDSTVKAELEEELVSYLKNLYRLTDDEIANLKEMVTTDDFSMDGNSDFEAVSKERMVAYFGK